MNIIVLAGGLSPERNVSLSSGSLISSALRRKGHKILMLDVYEGICDKKIPENPLSLFTTEDSASLSVGNTAPTPKELNDIKAKNNNRTELVGPNVLKLCKLADVTFLALHGDMGENGQLQATLDVFDVAYTGSGYIGSLLAMNKDIAKKLMRENGILTPDWINFKDFGNEEKIHSAANKIGFPCIVKPCSCGSSVGVSIVNNESELNEALEFASKYEGSVLIEKHISGRELTQAILDGEALPPVEIIPKCGFYDYANKYVADATEEICPAPISNELCNKVDNISKQCFDALYLSDYARIDYIVDKDQNVWCLEANTLPGMTPTSLMPQEANAVGIDYDSLCEKIAKLAYNKKNK
ncbi:MAG: D-alanine--D-alanine ligase [Ruminococcaceae bacterium]|nr:D-alanine--D-alanine ligase [Oscillospiraceae bacterium]